MILVAWDVAPPLLIITTLLHIFVLSVHFYVSVLASSLTPHSESKLVINLHKICGPHVVFSVGPGQSDMWRAVLTCRAMSLTYEIIASNCFSINYVPLSPHKMINIIIYNKHRCSVRAIFLTINYWNLIKPIRTDIRLILAKRLRKVSLCLVLFFSRVAIDV